MLSHNTFSMNQIGIVNDETKSSDNSIVVPAFFPFQYCSPWFLPISQKVLR